MTQYVFGPVPSRRLGRSLGVDLVPFKTCTLNCVYCQLGRTAEPTLERRSYVPVDEVLRQLQAALERGPQPDHITLSGSGEPTLNRDLGEVIRRARAMSGIPIALLTNGTLLGDETVAAQAALADLVLPSLDAGDQAQFQRINRPAPGLSFEAFVEGLIRFRERFPGQLWLEVLLLAGITDQQEEVLKIKHWSDRIRPDRIQLNTSVRPPAEQLARPVPFETLERLASLFCPKAEVIAPRQVWSETASAGAQRKSILETLRRRPCTVEDLSSGLGLHPEETQKELDRLQEEGAVESLLTAGRTYYRIPEKG